MTAPDPQRAVAEARADVLRQFRVANGESGVGFTITLDALIAAAEAKGAADERARLLATQDDADAQAPGYYTEGRR